MNRQFLSEREIFCNIINVFIITFDQFEAFLLNKSINVYHYYSQKIKNNTDSNLLNGSQFIMLQQLFISYLWIFIFIKWTQLQ